MMSTVPVTSFALAMSLRKMREANIVVIGGQHISRTFALAMRYAPATPIVPAIQLVPVPAIHKVAVVAAAVGVTGIQTKFHVSCQKTLPMKASYFFSILFLLSSLQLSRAQEGTRLWISGGATYGGFTGEGEKGNTFDQSPGVKFEFGYKGEGTMGLTFYTFSAYSSSNHLKDSSVDTKFNHHVWDIRYFFGTKKFQPYLSLGIGVGTMKLDGMKGRDRFTVIPFGGGGQFIAGEFIVEAALKPYFAAGNQLGHDFGYEAGLLVGYIFK